MATKKKTTETEMTPVTEAETKEQELMKALEKAKADKDALLREYEALKAKSNVPEKTKSDTKWDAEYWNELVPHVERGTGDDDNEDTIVSVNGRRFQIQKDEEVMIPRFVKQVLVDRDNQLRAARKHSRGLQDEFERETKKYIGE